MAWVPSGEVRLHRLVCIAMSVIVILHFLYMLQDTQKAWTASRAYLVPPSDGIEPGPPNATAVTRGPPTAAQAAAVSALIPAQPFPRKIWQTGRDGAATIDDETVLAVKTWTKLNEDWRHEILTDAGAETYVRGTFAHRPEIVETYLALGDAILRADMLRYLVLLGDGGVYCDMDTRALKPIDDWVPAAYRGKANVVVGIEYDKMDGSRWLDWTLDLQFTNWAMLAQPGHPLLELTVQKLIYELNVLAARKGQSLADVRPAYHEVLDTTGPALFSMAVFEWLSTATSKQFDWRNVTKLEAPRLVDDILILPVTGFGNSQPHSGSGNADSQNALVRHMFRGSWKDAHPMAKGGEDGERDENKDESQDHQVDEQRSEENVDTGSGSENPASEVHDSAVQLEMERASLPVHDSILP